MKEHYKYLYPDDEILDYTGKLDNHNEYLKIINMLEKKTAYIEIVEEHEIVREFQKDIVLTKEVSSWWSEETSNKYNLYRIKASKELFSYLRKYETFCRIGKTIWGSMTVIKTNFGANDIAFFDRENHILLKTVTHEGFININTRLFK